MHNDFASCLIDEAPLTKRSPISLVHVRLEALPNVFNLLVEATRLPPWGDGNYRLAHELEPIDQLEQCDPVLIWGCPKFGGDRPGSLLAEFKHEWSHALGDAAAWLQILILLTYSTRSGATRFCLCLSWQDRRHPALYSAPQWTSCNRDGPQSLCVEEGHCQGLHHHAGRPHAQELCQSRPVDIMQNATGPQSVGIVVLRSHPGETSFLASYSQHRRKRDVGFAEKASCVTIASELESYLVFLSNGGCPGHDAISERQRSSYIP
jgi:hypothetical protein